MRQLSLLEAFGLAEVSKPAPERIHWSRFAGEAERMYMRSAMCVYNKKQG